MKCGFCDGKGFVEYDAGLLVIGCATCSGIGKVNCELTKEEFESGYAFRSDMWVDQVRELGLEGVVCDCEEPGCAGWAMQKIEVVAPIEESEPELESEPESNVAIVEAYLETEIELETAPEEAEQESGVAVGDVSEEGEEASQPPAPKDKPVPKKGQYLCNKCGICHTEAKKTGQKHLQHKAV